MEEQANPIQAPVENYNVYSKIFGWMFMGLLLTAIVGWYTFSTGIIYDIIVNEMLNMLLIAEVVVVIIFSWLRNRISATVASILFFAYAALNGVFFATIFVIFQMSSIMSIFLVAAALFGIFALIGAKTKIDLSKIGVIALGVVVVGVIMSIINLFMNVAILDTIVSWVILLAFFAITAYDMQKIKQMVAAGYQGDKLHIYAAFELYLDFINIFIRLLSLFGKRN